MNQDPYSITRYFIIHNKMCSVHSSMYRWTYSPHIVIVSVGWTATTLRSGGKEGKGKEEEEEAH